MSRDSDVDDLQRTVDEAIGDANLRDDAHVGEPLTVGEFAEVLTELRESERERPVFECPSCGHRVGLEQGTPGGGLPSLTCLDCSVDLVYQGVGRDA